jgi:hypothetical protein
MAEKIGRSLAPRVIIESQSLERSFYFSGYIHRHTYTHTHIYLHMFTHTRVSVLCVYVLPVFVFACI